MVLPRWRRTDDAEQTIHCYSSINLSQSSNFCSHRYLVEVRFFHCFVIPWLLAHSIHIICYSSCHISPWLVAPVSSRASKQMGRLWANGNERGQGQAVVWPNWCQGDKNAPLNARPFPLHLGFDASIKRHQIFHRWASQPRLDNWLNNWAAELSATTPIFSLGSAK